MHFDHTIVPSTDRERSAAFYADVLGLPPARREGPFAALDLDNQVSLYIAGWYREVERQHYAFLVSDEEFDAILGRVTARGQEHWADAHATRAGEVNDDDGGRGTYFRDPDGHFLEIITVRYGAGA